jgi:hypothetical protein
MSMSPLAALNKAVLSRIDTGERAGDFCSFARMVASSPDDLPGAAFRGERHLPAGRAVAALKAAVNAGSTSDPAFAALADYSIMATGFLASLRSLSAFDAMLGEGGMRKVPLEQKLAVVSVALVGGGVNQAAIKPVSVMHLDVSALAARKAVAMIIASDELLRFSTPAAMSLFSSELKAAVAAATDLLFLGELLAQTTPTPSSGTTADAALTDIGALLDAIDPRANSKVYMVLRPEQARSLKLFRDTAPIFPDMELTGGSVIGGVTALVSDQLQVGTALMVDAASLVAGSDTVLLDASRYSSLQFSSTPDSPPTAASNVESLFQSGRSALKCERLFGFDVVRASGIASLSGVAW